MLWLEPHDAPENASNFVGCYNSPVNGVNAGYQTSASRVIARIFGSGAVDTSIYMTDASVICFSAVMRQLACFARAVITGPTYFKAWCRSTAPPRSGRRARPLNPTPLRQPARRRAKAPPVASDTTTVVPAPPLRFCTTSTLYVDA
jgi:hypothetical protein